MVKMPPEFEAEVREKCGEEFLASMKKQRRRSVIGERFAIGCVTIMFGLAFVVLFVLPAISMYLRYSRYHALDRGTGIAAMVTAVTFENDPAVNYRYEAGGETRKGKSKIPKPVALELTSGGMVQVLYDPERPGRSRAVQASSPFKGSGGIIFLWVIFGTIGGLKLLSWIKTRGKAETQSELPWLEYITSETKPPPRAWAHTATTTIEPGVMKALQCETAIGPQDLLIQNALIYTVPEWIKENEGCVSFDDFFLRMKYAVRLQEQNFGPIQHREISIPESMTESKVELGLGVGYRMIAELANSGTAGYPEFTEFEIQLNGLNVAETVRQHFLAEKIEHKVRSRMHLTTDTENEALKRALEEEGVDGKEKPYWLNKRARHSRECAKQIPLDSVSALRMVRALLFVFYERPWREEAICKETPYDREDGRRVILRLEYEPGRSIRAIRIAGTEAEEDNQLDIATTEPLENAEMIQPGAHEGNIGKWAYKYHLKPASETEDQGYYGITKEENLTGESNEINEGANQISVFVFRREGPLKGFWLGLMLFFKFLFWPMRFPIFNLDFYRRCGIKSDLRNRAFVKWLLGSAERRRAILELFDLGYAGVFIKDGNWSALAHVGKDWNADRKIRLDATMERLAFLAEGALVKVGEYWVRARRQSRIRIWTNFIVVGLVSLGAFVCMFGKPDEAMGRVIEDDPLLVYSLRFTIVPMFIYAYWILWTTRFASTGRFIFVIGGWFWGLVSLLLIGSGIVGYYNQVLDTAPANAMEALIVRKESGNKYRYIALQSWRPDKNEIRYSKVPFYRQVIPGQTRLAFNSHPGHFGFEWISEPRLVGPVDYAGQ